MFASWTSATVTDHVGAGMGGFTASGGTRRLLQIASGQRITGRISRSREPRVQADDDFGDRAIPT
ncbi:MAG: hypothetical protein DMG00_00420 [Acidobacteria bacterium]|nr:MAG: hypothetical protein DMG00_00420 [Acidobacteriota bacterium]